MEAKYEEHFVAYVDLLGFSEVSKQVDEATRIQVLRLLQDIARLRQDFDYKSEKQEGSVSLTMQPAITTFSDHIVVSYPLALLEADLGANGASAHRIALSDFTSLLSRIAAAALRMGFLIRGGATIGMLYHAGGVVFGNGLVEAFALESEIAVYPRVVVSQKVVSRDVRFRHNRDIGMGFDGLYHIDYYRDLILRSSRAGDNYIRDLQSWFTDVVQVISRKLAELQAGGG